MGFGVTLDFRGRRERFADVSRLAGRLVGCRVQSMACGWHERHQKLPRNRLAVLTMCLPIENGGSLAAAKSLKKWSGR